MFKPALPHLPAHICLPAPVYSGKTCLREMEWVWRGEHYAATRAEYLAIKNQLQAETFPPLPGAGEWLERLSRGRG